jgi:transposase-like protein
VAIVAVQCPECGSDEVVKYGQQPNGQQRYRCNNPHCGIRDTARVLGVSPMTVMSTLKKKRRRSTK